MPESETEARSETEGERLMREASERDITQRVGNVEERLSALEGLSLTAQDTAVTAITRALERVEGLMTLTTNVGQDLNYVAADLRLALRIIRGEE